MSRSAENRELWEAVSALSAERVTYLEVPVTDVDPASSTVTVRIDDEQDGRDLAGIPATPQFLPDVGQVVQIALFGAQPILQPAGIAEGAITSRELDPSIEDAIDQAVERSTVALVAADGKNAVVFATTTPNVSGGRPGDTWWQRSGTIIVGTWEWDGDSWEPRKFGDAVFDTVSAGRIVTGQLAVGVTVYVGDPAADHTRISSAGIVAYAADPIDGVPNEVARFGRTYGTTNPVTGEQTSLVDERGNASYNEVSANSIRHNGTTLDDILRDYSTGVQAWYGAGALVSNIALEYGVMEQYRNLRRDRNYTGTVGITLASTENDGEATVRVRITSDGSRPTVQSTVIVERNVTLRVGGRWNDYAFPFFFQRDSDDGQDVKFLVTVARGNGQATGTVATAGNPPFMWIADAGPYTDAVGTTANIGTVGGSSVAPPSRQTATITGVWGRNFTGTGAVRSDTADLMQGNTTASGDGKAMVGFGNLATLLAGASVRSVRVYLYAYAWYGTDGTAILGTHGQTSVPAAFSGTTNRLQVAGWKRAQGRWVDLTAWKAEFQSGAARGITLGPSGGTDVRFAGRFAGVTDANVLYRPKLEVVYYK